MTKDDPKAGAAVVHLAGLQAWLLPARALWLPDAGCVVVSDVHLGTEHSFQTAGMGVPVVAFKQDLLRLVALVRLTGAARLVVLGDLVHRDITPTVDEQVRAWRADLRAELLLVRGNHDRQVGVAQARAWAMDVREQWDIGNLSLMHAPDPVPGRYVVGGHLHPVAILAGAADRMRFPAFHLGEAGAVLPAFGGLTGGRVLRRARGDRQFACLPGRVLEIPG